VNLPAFSVSRPIFTSMVMLIVIVLGTASLIRIKVDLFPSIELPTVSIRTGYEGASPEVVEAQVTEIIEEIIATVPGVEEITSQSSEGGSRLRVRFAWGKYPNPTDEQYIAKLRDHYRGEFSDGLAFATGTTTDRASKMLGKKVVDATGKEIGSIDDLILDQSNGKIEYAVLSCGGFLGIGDKLVVVPRESLTHDAGTATCTLDVTKESLESAVEYDDELLTKLSDPACCASIGRPFLVRETGATGIRPVLATKLIKCDITSSETGEEVGQMKDLAIDPTSGKVRYAVILL
jgi:sporulation protein YlmC with PRC-barrel domain